MESRKQTQVRTRNTTSTETDLALECSRMFYERGLKKTTIATTLGLSGMRVTRLIRKAKKLGFVQIRIVSQPQCDQLGAALRKRFGLRHVRIAEFDADYDKLRKRLGSVAATLFDEEISLRESTTVGIGGGGSIYDMVESLNVKPRHISIYPMAMFGRGPEIVFFDSSFLVTLLLLKSQPTAKGFAVGIPPLPSDPKKAITFSQELCKAIPEINEVLSCSRDPDVCVVSLGTSLECDDPMKKLCTEAALARPQRLKAIVGGINYNYFDRCGNEIENYILKVNINELRELAAKPSRTVILVAGGETEGRRDKDSS